MTERRQTLAALALLAAATLTLLWLGVRLARVTPLPLGRDEDAHLKTAYLFEERLRRDPLGFLLLLSGRNREHGYNVTAYPPLQPAVTAVLKALVPHGRDFPASVATLYPFWFVLLASLYLAGRRIHSHEAGLLAAGTVIFYPIVFRQMPVYNPYSVVAAPVALTYAALLATDRLTRSGAAALLGLAAGAALVTYYTAALFLAAPAAVFAVRHLAAGDRAHRLRVLASIALAALVAAAVALPYYTNPTFQSFWHKVSSLFFGRVRGTPGDFGLGAPEEHGLAAHLFYYFIVLWTEQLGPAALGAFAVGAGLLLRKSRGHRLEILAGCLVPLVALSFVSSKLVERTVPALPFFALATGIGLATLPRRWQRVAAFLVLAVLSGVPLAREYRERYRKFAAETAAGRTYERQLARFRQIAARGGEIDVGCGSEHTFYEYMAALAGMHGALRSAVHDPEFYERFDELEVVTYFGTANRPEEWFTEEYLAGKQALRAHFLPAPLPRDPVPRIVAARDRFLLLGCDEILDRKYCVYVRRSWWEGPATAAPPSPSG